MGDFFTMLMAQISALVAWFGSLFTAIFVSLWDLLKDAFSWGFEQVLGLVSSILNSFDLTPFAGLAAAMGSIPANALAVMSSLGLGYCLGLIVAAIGIRLLLQLIPFTRLGS